MALPCTAVQLATDVYVRLYVSICTVRYVEYYTAAKHARATHHITQRVKLSITHYNSSTRTSTVNRKISQLAHLKYVVKKIPAQPVHNKQQTWARRHILSVVYHAGLYRRSFQKKMTNKMKTYPPHWLPFECSKKGGREALRGPVRPEDAHPCRPTGPAESRALEQGLSRK